MNNNTYIDQTDFKCVGLVAKHCDLEKLNIAIEESKQFDMIPLFCFEFVHDLLVNWHKSSLTLPNPNFNPLQPVSVSNPITIANPNFDQKYNKLIEGGTFTDSGSQMQQNLGFKRVWVYYSYARYQLISPYSDTPNGLVGKKNEFSLPIPLGEITAFSNKYRSMGKQAYESVLGYLCENKSLFPKFNDCNCRLSCGCSGSCLCGKTKKLTGFTYSTVKK